MNSINLKDLFFLYVEDDFASRNVMRLIFEKMIGTKNYAFLENSVDFIQRVKSLERTPNIFLLDIHVSPIDGFEMLRQLRADQTFSQSKILALTASVMNEEVLKLRGSGFDSAIGKPLNFQDFPEQIVTILKGGQVWIV